MHTNTDTKPLEASGDEDPHRRFQRGKPAEDHNTAGTDEAVGIVLETGDGIMEPFFVVSLPSWKEQRTTSEHSLRRQPSVTDFHATGQQYSLKENSSATHKVARRQEWIPKKIYQDEKARKRIVGMASQGFVYGSRTQNTVTTIPKIGERKKATRLLTYLSQKDREYINTAIAACYIYPDTPIHVVELEPYGEFACYGRTQAGKPAINGYGGDYIKDWCLSRTLLLQGSKALLSCVTGLLPPFGSVLDELCLADAEQLVLLYDAEMDAAFRTLLASNTGRLTGGRKGYKDSIVRALRWCQSEVADWLLTELLGGRNFATSAHIASVTRLHAAECLNKEIAELKARVKAWRELKALSELEENAWDVKVENALQEVESVLGRVHDHCAFQIVLKCGFSRDWDVLCNDTALLYIQAHTEEAGQEGSTYGPSHTNQHWRNLSQPTNNPSPSPPAAKRIPLARSQGAQNYSTTLRNQCHAGDSEQQPPGQPREDALRGLAQRSAGSSLAVAKFSASSPEANNSVSRLPVVHESYVYAKPKSTPSHHPSSSTRSSRLSYEKKVSKKVKSRSVQSIYNSNEFFMSKILISVYPRRTVFDKIAYLANSIEKPESFRIVPYQRNRYDQSIGFRFELSKIWLKATKTPTGKAFYADPSDAFALYEKKCGEPTGSSQYVTPIELNPNSSAASDSPTPSSVSEEYDKPVITMAIRAKILLKRKARIAKNLTRSLKVNLSEDCARAENLSLHLVLPFTALHSVHSLSPRPRHIERDKQELTAWYVSRLLCSSELSGSEIDRVHQSRRAFIIRDCFRPVFYPALPLFDELRGVFAWACEVVAGNPTAEYKIALLRHLRSSGSDIDEWLFHDLILGMTSKNSVHIACVLGAHSGHLLQTARQLERRLGESMDVVQESEKLTAQAAIDEAITEIVEECAFWSVLRSGIGSGENIAARAIEGYFD
ncbi:hypothetical protein BJ508DRAFT_328171 [Ascobolus immersus RN42]|uniref:Uncharacterized protein n=1 Tax=Ascobolus immersus RN42 TaxID=1160509 RepID=A0A3N4I0G8_ASCIM|nr:hypothetical protein BJ508DRAFT_328171 [Ascobolus immersus RN42]